MKVNRAQAWSQSMVAALLPVALFVAGGATRAPAATAAAPHPVLQITSGVDGEVRLDARNVPIADVLRPLAEQGGFDVLMDDSVSRPLVDLSVPMAPVQDVLQELLRGRNYALVYYGESDSPSLVILLPPSTPGKAAGPAKAPIKPHTPSGPTVVSR